MHRIEVEVIRAVGQRVRLDAHNAEMLPLFEVVAIRFTPGFDIAGERFPADLDRKKLLLGSQGSAADKTFTYRIEVGRQKIVEHDSLSGGSGMPVKNRVWEKAIHVREHLRHEVATKLAALVTNAGRVFHAA